MANSEQSSIPNKRMIRMPVKRYRDPPDLGLIGVLGTSEHNAELGITFHCSQNPLSLESTETTRVTRGRPSLIVPALSTASALSFPIASRNALHLICTPRRAIAVRPETTLLFSTGIDSPVKDGVPLTTCAVRRNSR
jgi:hypothetical protein